MYYNESSYYRANPFYRQGYIPDRAFVNRKAQENLVELPQGDSHFQPTRRRHYGAHDTTQIQQNNLFIHPDERLKPTVAIHKEFQRNLETKDIEGAVTNTLISPVIRNRMRSQELKKIYEFNQQSSKDMIGQAQSPASRERQQQIKNMMREESNLLNSPGQVGTPSNSSNTRNYHMREAQGHMQGPPQTNEQPKAVQFQANQSQQLQRQSQPQTQRPAPQMQSLEPQPRYVQHDQHAQYQSQQKYPARQYTEQKSSISDRERQAQIDALHARLQEQRRRADEQKQDYRTIEQPAVLIAPRRINPTFLSYGSNPFNLAAQNIIRQ